MTTCKRCYAHPALFRLQTDILDLPVCLACIQAAIEMSREVPGFEYKLVRLIQDNDGRIQ